MSIDTGMGLRDCHYGAQQEQHEETVQHLARKLGGNTGGGNLSRRFTSVKHPSLHAVKNQVQCCPLLDRISQSTFAEIGPVNNCL